MSNKDYSDELADLVTTAMAEKNMTIGELAEQLDVVYEHARKISKGFPPSKPAAKLLAKALSLDEKELIALVRRANIKRKYGDDPLVSEGKNPELAPIETAWKHLSSTQKQDAIALIQTMAKRSKQVARA